nr:hypothetical protein [Tanacetum cinerariifolium]
MLHGILKLEGHPSIMIGFLRNIEGIRPLIRQISCWRIGEPIQAIQASNSAFVPFLWRWKLMDQVVSTSRQNWGSTQFWVLNCIARQHARYSIDDGLQHSVDFVGHLALLLFEIDFKLGYSSILRFHEFRNQSFHIRLVVKILRTVVEGTVVLEQDELSSSVGLEFRVRLDDGRMYSGHLEAKRLP